MNEPVTDQIDKEIIVHAPLAKVWRALTDAREFGRWFGAEMDGPFAPGQRAQGKITSPGYEHLRIELIVERLEPERLFSWRWHPWAVDPEHDYSGEPTTLVVFQLDEAPQGTRIRVTESGFDNIPLARRGDAFRMNSGGWAAQMKNIDRYVVAKD
jgi:uncharacterized protein YndB with AHSA1/START domain